MCVTSYCVHSQEAEYPVINAVSNAVKRHPNLVEVTLGRGCSAWITYFTGVLKGVLQKEDVRKVDVIESQFPIDPLSKSADVWSSECECFCVCVVLQCLHVFIVCLHVFSYQGGHCPRVPHTCNEEGVTESSACSVE